MPAHNTTETVKCPWPKTYVRDAVKTAIERVGGPNGWSYLSVPMREAVIAEAVLSHITMAALTGAMVSGLEMVAIRRAFRAEANIEEC